jgi:ATP-binding cassette subfamily B protein
MEGRRLARGNGCRANPKIGLDARRSGGAPDGRAFVDALVRLELRMFRRRVPFVPQMTTTDCGAACIAMVVSYFGRPTSLAESREICAPGRDGNSGNEVAAGARRFGLRVRTVSADIHDLPSLDLPAILHWDFRHYVVLESIERRGYRVIDPGRGRRRVSRDEIDRRFTGVAFCLTLGETGLTPVSSTTSPTGWATYLRDGLRDVVARRLLGQVALASLLLQVFGLVVPALTLLLVDQVLPFRLAESMSVLALGLGVVTLARTVVSLLRSVLLVKLRNCLDLTWMGRFIKHLFALPYEFFQRRATGDLVTRIGSNATIRDVVATQTVSALLDGLFVIGYLVFLVAASPRFSIVVAVLGALQVAILVATREAISLATTHELTSFADVQSTLTDAVTNALLVKATGAEQDVIDRWSERFGEYLKDTAWRNTLSGAAEAAMVAVRVGGALMLLWYGAREVLVGRLSLGEMLALNALAAALLVPVSSLTTTFLQLQVARAHLERIADVLRETPERRGGVAVRLDRAPRIDVEGLSFRYHPTAQLVLDRVSFSVPAGAKFGIAGRTGSGKSTLVRVLLGLHECSEGVVRFDGLRLESIDLLSLRRQVGVVLQDGGAISGSIRDNVGFGGNGMPLPAVAAAVRAAALDDDIQRMPMGFDTPVLESGSGLSGGERQRLAIARAIARGSSLLVFDEATSHLDALTEHRIDQSIGSLTCTRIVVAHRLAAIRNADLILVLESGQVAGIGTHNDLIMSCPIYAAMAREQGITPIGPSGQAPHFAEARCL